MTRLFHEPALVIGQPVMVAPGVHRLSLPMRANPGHVNAYLLEDEAGLVIVDTGNHTDETRATWEQVLASPLAAGGVRAVLLTHAHPDHAGNAAWLAQRSGAPVWLADAEHDALHRLWRGSIKQADEVTAFFVRWGIPADQCLNILGMLKYFRYGCPALDDCMTAPLADGQCLRIGDRDWQLHVGAGHTPANVALYAPRDGLLISGDHLLPTIYPNISVWWGAASDPLRDYLDSLPRFAALAPRRVLPSHGPLFGDLPQRIDEITRFHRRRMLRALAQCAQPCTAYESIAAVVHKPATGPVVGLVAGQVLATFAWLESEGLLERVDDQPLRFRAVPGAEARLQQRWGGELADVAGAALEEEAGH